MILYTEQDYHHALFIVKQYEQQKEFPFPKFVFLHISEYNKTALRLIALNGQHLYYRDAGSWFVDFTNTLLSIFNDEDGEECMLNNKMLTKCSYSEWKDDNREFSRNVTEENSLDITQGYFDPALVLIDY